MKLAEDQGIPNSNEGYVLPHIAYLAGQAEERTRCLQSLMDQQNMTLRQAMECLDVPSFEYNQHAEVLQKRKKLSGNRTGA